jgi:hypothetical protein
MGSRQITIELPDEMYERLLAVSRDSGSSLDATIAELVGRSLNNNGRAFGNLDVAARRRELQRIRAALGPLVEHPAPIQEGTSSLWDAESAAEFRRSMPVLDPPLSQTIIEEREDRV